MGIERETQERACATATMLQTPMQPIIPAKLFLPYFPTCNSPLPMRKTHREGKSEHEPRSDTPARTEPMPGPAEQAPEEASGWVAEREEGDAEFTANGVAESCGQRDAEEEKEGSRQVRFFLQSGNPRSQSQHPRSTRHLFAQQSTYGRQVRLTCQARVIPTKNSLLPVPC